MRHGCRMMTNAVTTWLARQARHQSLMRTGGIAFQSLRMSWRGGTLAASGPPAAHIRDGGNQVGSAPAHVGASHYFDVQGSWVKFAHGMFEQPSMYMKIYLHLRSANPLNLLRL